MAQLFEGTFKQGRVVDAEIGKSGKKAVRWGLVVVDDGIHQGKVARYSGKLDADSIKFTKRDMIAIGWQPNASGKYDISTFVSDVEKANKLVPFSAEIATFKRDDGSIAEWTAARMGGVGKPLQSLDSDETRQVNQMFAEAGGDDLPF